MKDYVICCDWGTTNLRIRLIDAVNLTVVDEELSSEGVSSVFDRWNEKEGNADLSDRIHFYLTRLKAYIDKLADRNAGMGTPPVIISGMASSSIGMMELPYAELPFPISGEYASAYYLAATHEFGYPIVLLSGVKGEEEVMRGEESQLIGISDRLEERNQMNNTIVILPGTHSKHVYIDQGQMIGMRTYITGELFSALAKNGLIKESIKPPIMPVKKGDWNAFRAGIIESGKSEMLNALFKVRINQLFNKMAKEENYQFMSGLLIGSELRSLPCSKVDHIVLCSEANLFEHYVNALEFLGLNSRTSYIDPEETAQATIRGQLKVAKRYLKNDEI